MKKKIIFDSNTEWNDEIIYNFLVQDFYKICVKKSKKELTYSGFCSILYREFKHILGFASYNVYSYKIIGFIKKYGKWNSECYYDCLGYKTNNPDQFIYPRCDWNSRIKLLKAAIKNYKNENK